MLYLEDGVEERNVIEHNLAAHVHFLGAPEQRLAVHRRRRSATTINPAGHLAAGFYITNAFNHLLATPRPAAGPAFPSCSRPCSTTAVSKTPRRLMLTFSGITAHSSGFKSGRMCIYLWARSTPPRFRRAGTILGGRLQRATRARASLTRRAAPGAARATGTSRSTCASRTQRSCVAWRGHQQLGPCRSRRRRGSRRGARYLHPRIRASPEVVAAARGSFSVPGGDRSHEMGGDGLNVRRPGDPKPLSTAHQPDRCPCSSTNHADRVNAKPTSSPTRQCATAARQPAPPPTAPGVATGRGVGLALLLAAAHSREEHVPEMMQVTSGVRYGRVADARFSNYVQDSGAAAQRDGQLACQQNWRDADGWPWASTTAFRPHGLSRHRGRQLVAPRRLLLSDERA